MLEKTIFSTMLVLASTTAIVKSSSISNCTENNHFLCSNLHCIDPHLRCDGTNDCGDNSDESNCDHYLCTEPHFFRCHNHRCIMSAYLCDGDNDCNDLSDELNCDEHNITTDLSISFTPCEKHEWQCTDKLCIPNDWVCNGEVDCLDGSDEGIGCTVSRPKCEGFRCANQGCIVPEWRCDGIDDCGDNSDERDCKHHFNPRKCTLNENKYLCKDGRACLDLHDVCNGKFDCFDKSDEGELCGNSEMNCSTHNCSHECVQLPSGPTCICPIGFHNNGSDKAICTDINECNEYGICDQKCRNFPGSYQCYCDTSYTLQEDNRTCKAEHAEATMIFASRHQIRSYLLRSDLLFGIANELQAAVGIDFDGKNIFWTEVLDQHEAIFKAAEDGSDKEAIVTSGISLPESLAIDWLTGNIYFTDLGKKHIGTCTNDGLHCTILINKNIQKPRGMVLNVHKGTMYWTDWGQPAEIAFSQMDGSHSKPFLTKNIYWPNGLALDYPNGRLYWTDAKKHTLESVKLDGAGRRIILHGIVKHPFSIAIFENKLYWADWGTKSIDSCDKFTGKNHRTIIRDRKEYIYEISIYHSALHTRKDNPCERAYCSDICLLRVGGYRCACAEGRVLEHNGHVCKDEEKAQSIVVAVQNLLIKLDHKSIGKHLIKFLPNNVVKKAAAITYNPRNHSLFISDSIAKEIIEYNLHNSLTLSVLALTKVENVIAMDYDYAGNNLYFCEKTKGTLEVINLNTMARKVLIHDNSNDIPMSVALVPSEGVLFVALSTLRKNKTTTHIDRMQMDGTGRTHVKEKGFGGSVTMYYDSAYHRIFLADTVNGEIMHIGVEGDDLFSLISVYSSPNSLATLNLDLFWVNKFSKKLHWTSKSSGDDFSHKLDLDISIDRNDLMYITAIKPVELVENACQYNNGNCSHLCLASHKSIICACPTRMILDKDNKTCLHRAECDANEFTCSLSNTCISNKLKCNGHNDCPMGEDEDNCRQSNNTCSIGYWSCNDGACIQETQVCNHQYDCKDKSDEHNCQDKDGKDKCPPGHFKCDFDGKCRSNLLRCDKIIDCWDSSDEKGCDYATCSESQFRCDSGTCIPKNWECDHEYDCDDFSDEHSGCASSTCPSHMFTCQNSKCIPKKFLCDEIDDCGDNSDESTCSLISNSPDCSNLEDFACHRNGTMICLPPAAKCNGTSECDDGLDEKKCTNCDSDSFECHNKKCISKSWTCDGTDDCGDNSDENDILCKSKKKQPSSSLLPFNYKPCNDGFRCKTGQCIPLNLVCNNHADCSDNSDEGGLCNESCSDRAHDPCSHTCASTPNGPKCSCHLGYKLLGDGVTCEDINECEMNPPVCSQLCINNVGYYYCDCYPGFHLRYDRGSCKSTGAPLSIIFAISNQIRELNQKNNSLNIIYMNDMIRVTSLDVAMANESIYFTTENSQTIQQIDVRTQKRHYMENVGRPKELALDWSTGNVYYYNDQLGDKSIAVCNLIHIACAPLLTIDSNLIVTGLTVDSVNKVMFYSLTNWWIFKLPSFQLYRTNLDGKDRVELVNSTSGRIAGITYDINKKHIYYADGHFGNIYRIDYNGKGKRVLKSNLGFLLPGLKFFENVLYFSSNTGTLTKCYLYGEENCETFRIHANKHDLFTLSQTGLQPFVANPCLNNTCQHLCLASGTNNYKCLCRIGIGITKDETCDIYPEFVGKEKEKPTLTSVDLNSNSKSSVGSTTITSVITISLILIILAGLLVGYAKRKNVKYFNFRVRYYNKVKDQNRGSNNILLPGQHEYVNPIQQNDQSKMANSNDGNNNDENAILWEKPNSSPLIDV